MRIYEVIDVIKDIRKDIIEFLEQDIKVRCERSNNFFGRGCYYHMR